MKVKPDTFIILTPGFPGDEAEDNCLPFQQAFARRLKEIYPALQVRVISFQYPFKKTAYSWNNCLVTSFNGRNKGGISKRLLRYRILRYLSGLHKQEHVTGILSFWMGECAWVGKRFADKYRVTHHCWIMGQDARPGNPYASLFKNNPGVLIGLSDSLADELYRNYGIRVAHIIPPGVDVSLYDPRIRNKDIDLLAAGSLISLKQFDILMEIVAILAKQKPGIRLVLCGKGPEELQLKKLRAQYGLEKNILFTGEVPHAELLRLMQRSRVLVHPSAYEGFSGVCMEALYAGCSVISFTKPMHRDYPGWYVVKDKESMLMKTQELLQPSTEGKKHLIQTIDETVSRLAQLFSFP